MARKNQDTEAKLAAAKKEIENLRNEVHNLKRKIKRMEDRKETALLETAEESHNVSSDLKAWKKQNLSENLAAKRARVLGNAA